jgi:AmmeMemoRadiSam system protein A
MDEETKKKLLAIARRTVEAAVKGERPPEFYLSDPELQGFRGAFVTIKKHGQLRGCIGNFVADEPLYKVVHKMALASATQDARFFGNQVTPDELKDIDIEISVLSPLTRIDDPMKIELGKHGIYIVNRRLDAAGCFLPQVATETGWSKEEFLTHCTRDKARLPPDAWRYPDTEVYVFTAEILEEKPAHQAQ